jgi:hypothetical protein
MRSAASIALFLTLAAVSLAGAGPVVPTGSQPGRFLRPTRPARTAVMAPFHAGERLFYQIGWMNLTDAATAELKVESRRNFYGDAAWHFQAVAQTENPLRMLMVVDDQFDSYCDAATLATRQYELYLNEQGKRSVRKLALGAGSPGAEKIFAPQGTRDPLAMLYRLRSVDWRRTPQISSSVYDGRHFYDMVARLASLHDRVNVPAGSFDASRIEIRVSPRGSGGEPMQFTLWLANDSARTPVEVDAEISLGTVKGELVRIE